MTAPLTRDASLPRLTRGRIDRVHVQVGLREGPEGPVGEQFLLELPAHEDGQPPDEEGYLARLEPVLRADGERPLHHSLHVHRWHTSWGVAGGALEIGLTVTTGSGDSRGTSARHAVAEVFRELLELGESPTPTPVTREQAVVIARRSVAAAYALDPEDLALTSEQHQADRGTWTLGLRAPALDRFVVVVGLVDGYAGSVHVRHRPADEVTASLGTE